MAELTRIKRKTGGAVCAMGGCSNRCGRNKRSSIPSRDFLRYISLPKDPTEREKWLIRMNRDPRSWNPKYHTRICTDHFQESDFIEADLIRHRNRKDASKRTQIRLKRQTSEFVAEFLKVRQIIFKLVFMCKYSNKPFANHGVIKFACCWVICTLY